ncbi:rhodanese-like domain-containing protein [Facklamia miroungae]|uniref:Rhodanese-related sulfurtransferase n=1 Tax=Facklamia miroungae TaxID=120956 RepID=A0A1G7V9T1_9LACT|nr:rhodanese-like domain-containing protein [Facklamia miroungae]NKZ30275.1 rhodanese-like domain-containing protein [Facklamia miroungae]SDG56301.1 Rhodanese-related sulfurtransferase [Facklamia miroungae]
MSIFELFLWIIVAVSIIYGCYWVSLWIMRKRSAKLVASGELNDIIRKVQVIDVREVGEFDAKHILGARNIPMSQFKMRYSEIRKDIPVYLVDDNYYLSSRAANILRKNGYDQVFILKGGMEKWFGKTKSSL